MSPMKNSFGLVRTRIIFRFSAALLQYFGFIEEISWTHKPEDGLFCDITRTIVNARHLGKRVFQNSGKKYWPEDYIFLLKSKFFLM